VETQGRRAGDFRRIVVGSTLVVLVLSRLTGADVFNMPGSQTSLLFSTVGDAGNTADTNGYGGVSYDYQIGTNVVTVAQYSEFLNAVAKTDQYGLWNSGMGLPWAPAPGNSNFGQISRSGTPGDYSYTVLTGHENMPANFITWGDAVRFANWLSNGQPATGVEDATTTEDGSYYVNGAITNDTLNNVDRKANATFVIPTRNEWYKAAFYKGDGLNAGYWMYPTTSDTAPSNVKDPDGYNNVNYYNNGYTDPVMFLTEVGFFQNTTSPYGLYDVGGDVWQWAEDRLSSTTRICSPMSFARYGLDTNGVYHLAKTDALHWFSDAQIDGSVGFRVALIPEPASLALMGIGVAVLLMRRRHN
jgi:sulfatase modifying factor 1